MDDFFNLDLITPELSGEISSKFGSLKDFIRFYLAREFEDAHYTGNAAQNAKIDINASPRGLNISVEFPRYSWIEYQRSKTIVPTYYPKGYAQELDEGRAKLIFHKKVVDKYGNPRPEVGGRVLRGGYSSYYVVKHPNGGQNHTGWFNRVITQAIEARGIANGFIKV